MTEDDLRPFKTIKDKNIERRSDKKTESEIKGVTKRLNDRKTESPCREA